MTDTSASHLRALASDVQGLQQRLRDTLGVLDGITPDVAFRLGEASALLGSAARTMESAAEVTATA
ncbi:hypothetical protein AB4225_28975 [Streptomyces sp. 2RAF24]|uniref:hypothetical protein n=1 Tax=Streptomyces sp. 2RAF24 TaxID=3232997 RepID=UPI003F9441FE